MRNSIKSLINKFLSKGFGLKLYSVLAHGRDDVTDIGNSGHTIQTIFDVGANHGQSITKFLGAFPEAEIYAFEPVAKTFITLTSKFKQVAKVNLFQLALGNEKSTQEIYVPQHNTMASLIKPQNYLASETVSVNSIDFFCQENEIFSIDLLKIDTEGYDLEVLLGARNMLEKREIKLILVEVGFNPKSDYHVLFDQVRDFLVPYGFALYGIYDQQLNWSGTKEIQYANVCFRLLGTLKE